MHQKKTTPLDINSGKEYHLRHTTVKYCRKNLVPFISCTMSLRHAASEPSGKHIHTLYTFENKTNLCHTALKYCREDARGARMYRSAGADNMPLQANPACPAKMRSHYTSYLGISSKLTVTFGCDLDRTDCFYLLQDHNKLICEYPICTLRNIFARQRTKGPKQLLRRDAS